MTTLARPRTQESAHFYTVDGLPLYEAQRADGSGMRPFTLSDAKKMTPRPLVSPTTILNSVLRKFGLESWLVEQGVLACITDPMLGKEPIDALVDRVMQQEREQEKEGKQAAAFGTRIHNGLRDELGGGICGHEILPWIEPVWDYLNELGCVASHCETVLIGDGYAGKTDLWQEFFPQSDWLWDFKTKESSPTKPLPKKSYLENRLQLAAYAKCLKRPVRTGNIYISRTEPGKFSVCINEDWQCDYEAFEHLLSYWMIVNDYRP